MRIYSKIILVLLSKFYYVDVLLIGKIFYFIYTSSFILVSDPTRTHHVSISKYFILFLYYFGLDFLVTTFLFVKRNFDSRLGHYAVVKYSADGLFYRVYISRELLNGDVEVALLILGTQKYSPLLLNSRNFYSKQYKQQSYYYRQFERVRIVGNTKLN